MRSILGNLSGILLAAGLLPLAATACLREDFKESGSSFYLDKTSYEVFSGSEITEQTITQACYPEEMSDVIVVSSNHNWRARLESLSTGDDLSWIELSEYDHINPSMSTQHSPLVMTAARNRTTSPRVAAVILTLPDGTSRAVAVTQRAAVPELREPEVLSRDGKVKDISNIRGYSADTCFVRFVCNTSWTMAKVAEETTADISVVRPSGEDDAVVEVVFRANTAKIEKTACVRIAAPGCESRTIRFIQAAGSSSK